MQYNILKDKIEIIGKDDFNPFHILECGQIFRFHKNDKGNYIVYSMNKKAEIEETETGYDILTNDPEYFVQFFNLSVDYTKIKEDISKLSPAIKDAVNLCGGLRILKGELFEIIVSFIISANNNIKRIKLIIDRLTKALGDDMGDYYAFPTVEQLKDVDEAFFKSIGAGYRAKYLCEVSKAYSLLIKEDLSAMSDIELRKKLMKIKGVGSKVADCIMLFAFNRKKIFPVDVWMERVYYEFFGQEKMSREKISAFLTNKFGDNSGYIQQYLFFSKTVKIKK